jgi:hypothetical protein
LEYPNMIRESLWWWSDYIVCNSEHPNMICNKKTSKRTLGAVRCRQGLPGTSVHILDRKASPPRGKPYGEIGGQSWRPRRRGQHNDGVWGRVCHSGEREWEDGVKGMKLKISTG